MEFFSIDLDSLNAHRGIIFLLLKNKKILARIEKIMRKNKRDFLSTKCEGRTNDSRLFADRDFRLNDKKYLWEIYSYVIHFGPKYISFNFPVTRYFSHWAKFPNFNSILVEIDINATIKKNPFFSLLKFN